MNEPSNKDQFWAWVHKNVTGYGILAALWMLVLVILSLAD